MLSEAPSTAIVDTSAIPIIRAAAVWAVRRGLRIEFSRPSLPGTPSTAASGRPSALDSGRATTGASMPAAMNTASAPTPTSPTVAPATPATTATSPRCDRDPGDHAPPAQRFRSVFGVVHERGDRRDPHRAPRRDDRRDHGDADADRERDDGRAGLEHERRGGQRDAERLQQRLQAERGEHAEPETDQRGGQPRQRGLAEHGPEHLPAAGSDDRAAAPARGSAARP